MTLREESARKRHGNINAKTMCKIDHLKELALWAAEASVPSLAAFFAERLSATNEALGVRGDPSLFVCERCESILQSGNNCSVRIEKNKSSKGRHGRLRSKATVQNNIVYRCHFCSHQNTMRGTPNGYVKEICPPKPKPAQGLKKVWENHPSSGNATTTVECSALLPLDGQDLVGSSLATPLSKSGLSLLDSKRRKRNRPGAKKADEPQISLAAADTETSTQASSKRRKRTWTSLKEIAENSGQYVGKKFTNSSVPFSI
ncbi:hypothetical protein SASPL_136422 [Salvia splendens]|uniref:RNAse P, Rpr2/Rpp21 subunit n=1 Tax=Salvia splendens TaxID=180675 RepID=A0A8X8X0K1_SALSN|nr:uncharacterized protein LOC121760127 [Salvia splendens]KAG6404182.1 hypothetical protein SASPL_136422 [Salvia splendens]